MKISSVKFTKSVFDLYGLPEPRLPEIAFSGRSNVGKSSLINKLLHHRNIAKTSSKPGKTQSINFIEVNKAFFFVDLPGYGYAEVPQAVKKKWQHLIEGYLKDRLSLRLVVLINDVRREPQVQEMNFVEWLSAHNIPLMIILTKADKVSKNFQKRSLSMWQNNFKNISKILLFSAKTGEGKSQLMKELQIYTSSKSREIPEVRVPKIP